MPPEQHRRHDAQHRDRLWTHELLAGLATMDAKYEQWTADDLAAVLRPLGVAPVQIKRDGRNRNGYHRDPIAQAWRDHQQRHGPGDGDSPAPGDPW